MKTYTLYLGLTDREGNPVPVETQKAALSFTAGLFGGYSAFIGEGGWTDEFGHYTQEPSMRIEVVTDAGYLSRTWAGTLRELANQDSVLLTSHSLNSAEFIGSTDAPASERIAA